MFGSRSRSSTTSTSLSTTDVQNLNLQDIEGLAIAGIDGVVSIQQTDQGAVQAARDIALAGLETAEFGLDAGRRGFSEVLDLATGVLRAGRAQTQAGLGLAGDIAARESQNVGARFENITRTVVIGAGVVLVIVVFAQTRKR